MEQVSWIAIAVIAISFAIAVTRKIPAAGSLLMANMAVFALSAFGPQLANGRSVIQQELSLHSDKLAAGEPIAFLQLFTSMFVHADFYHVIGNLIILFAFAFPFEERIGPKKFLVAYFGAGLVGSLAQVGTTWGDPIILMGASGAVFGIIGAFAGSYPRLVLPLPLPLFIIMIFVRMRVIVAAAVFTLMQIMYLIFLSPFDNTAYWAHLGGLVAGLAIAPMLRPKNSSQKKGKTPDLDFYQTFATNMRAKDAFGHMNSNKDDEQIFQMWLDVFVKHAEAPDGRRLAMKDGQVQVVELRS